ncbi:MAG TPA: AraC family transcriptional regulator [Chitinophagaceae bacterium]
MNFDRQLQALNHIVKDVHHFGIYGHRNEEGTYRIFADGLVGLTFYESEDEVFFNGHKSAQLFLYGQTVKPLEITYRSGFSVIVVYLQPYAIRYLFGIDASLLTDTCLDFTLINNQLTHDLLSAEGTACRIELLLNYLLKKSESLKKPPDERMVWATDKIIRESGRISIASLQRELFLSERTFERQFLKTVGVTPSTFSKICRFNTAMNVLKNKNFTNLTGIAYEAGYSDQSHFIRNFKEFTSLTPSQYISQIKSMADPV